MKDLADDLALNVRNAIAYIKELEAELARCKQVCAATAEAWREEAALAEPDVPATNFGNMEPVAWLWQHRETGRTRVLMPDERTATDVAAAWDVVGPLYLAPPQRKPMNEFDALRLVTESIGRLQSAGPVEGLIGIIRAIERAHGIGKHR
jgi:hypothetical protein